MAQVFNFKTRELSPYRDDWNGKGNVKVCGAMWYIQEDDGIFLLDTEETRTGESYNQTHERPNIKHLIAKGFPAAMLAQSLMCLSNFNELDCYHAYFRETESLFPERPRYFPPLIIRDWELTLQQSRLIDNSVNDDYINLFTLTKVAVFLRDRIINPFQIIDVKDKLDRNYYYVCRFANQTEPQVLFSHMPNFEERQAAPMIFSHGLNQPIQTSKRQADGFIATVFNLAIVYSWEKTWSRFNFTDLNLIERINKSLSDQTPLIEIFDIQELSFSLPVPVEKICKLYMDTFLPVMRKVWEHTPEVQLECTEGDNIYTYIYACEHTSVEDFLQSELYANLDLTQQRAIFSYAKRFSEWLRKNYPITAASQHRIMNAIGRDMPPIQLTIHNDIQVTHANEQPKEIDKFKYIISDDEDEIKAIHERIKLHLSSPSELRNELSDLQVEKRLSLPMDKPTEIIREVHRIWGDEAPKERSFVIAWVRRF